MSDPQLRRRPRDAVHELAAELIRSMSDPAVLLDRERRVAAASPGFQRLFGHDPVESRGTSIYDLFGDAATDGGLWELLERVAPARERVDDFQATLPGPDGRVHRVLCAARRMAGSDWLLLRFRDSDSALIESTDAAIDARLGALAARHAVDAVCLYRPDGVAVLVGPACEALVGVSRKEWLSARACDLVHPGDQAELVRAARDAVKGGTPRATVRARRSTGEQLWVELSLRAVADPELGPLLHATLRDVTEQRRAEAASQFLGRQRRLVLDSAAEAIFAVDPRGVITYVNPAAGRVLGYEPTELAGRPYRVLLSAEAAARDCVGSTLHDGIGRRSELERFVDRRGGTVLVECSCRPMRHRGEPAGAVITLREVGDRLRGESEARRAERAEGAQELLATLRHEINNPLTTLLAEASLLEAGGNTEAEGREMAASIAEQARRIRDVVRLLTEAQSGMDESLGPPGDC